MLKPNAIVSTSIRLDAPPDRAAGELLRAGAGLSVELDEGRGVRLDARDPKSPGFATVLDGLAKLGRPVYLEVDPETSAVRRLLIPLVVRVVGMEAAEDGYEVALEPSHARHRLKRAQSDFAEMVAQLRDSLERGSPLIVTEDDDHGIVDVRPFVPGPDEGPLPPFLELEIRPVPLLERIRRWRIWPGAWFGCISMARAQEVFDAIGATTCDPLTVPAPCIPFLYPDNGCWTRAHEMCRLMIAMGLSPRKIWISGTLNAATRNRDDCIVRWGWHVAPILCVRSGGFFPKAESMVFDPSLFPRPVTQADWKGAMRDPKATLLETDAANYYRGSTDPDYTRTNTQLAEFRLALLNRANQDGPPPYAKCP
jgi:hypothetical protein